MSTADDVTYLWTREAHADSRLLREWRHAFDWWEQQHVGSVTSGVTGLGAVGAAERRLSELHAGCRSLLLPSATCGFLVAMRVLGIGRGDEVLVPSVDWPASAAVVRLLGAAPIRVRVDSDTLTMDPSAARDARTRRTRAVVVCHFDGRVADVFGIREALPGVPLIEDCAAALGRTVGGQPVGSFGDFGILSFGPGKRLDAGEGGALLVRSEVLWRRAVALSVHPVRQAREQLLPDAEQPAMRPHPLSAIKVAYDLRNGLPPPTR